MRAQLRDHVMRHGIKLESSGGAANPKFYLLYQQYPSMWRRDGRSMRLNRASRVPSGFYDQRESMLDQDAYELAQKDHRYTFSAKAIPIRGQADVAFSHTATTAVLLPPRKRPFITSARVDGAGNNRNWKAARLRVHF